MILCVFPDAGRLSDYGQLSIIRGVFLGALKMESMFFVLPWLSHKSRRPVKSFAAAETLAVGEALDEGKVLKCTIFKLLNVDIELILITDSKDLFTSLSTQRSSIDKYISADVNSILFELETYAVDKIVWIPNRLNLADTGTKRDNSLSDVLQLLLFTGKLQIDFTEAEIRSTDRALG